MRAGKSVSEPLELAHDNVQEKDRSLLNELCMGVLRQYFSLAAIAQQLLQKPLRKKDSDIYALLLIGLYQLIYLRTPDHAALNETVAAVKLLKKHWAKNFLNASLRNFLKNREKIESSLLENKEYCYSHPLWMIEKIEFYYADCAEQIFSVNNAKPPLTLRINILKKSSDNYLKALREKHIDCRKLAVPLSALEVTKVTSISELPGFREGDFFVQDQAAQLAAELLNLSPGMRILDACCAPGGKSTHILQHCPELQSLVCVDNSAKRMEKVRENFKRIFSGSQLEGLLGKVHYVVDDATQLKANERFERILLDAPCSATGVIRRHPDIKLLRRLDDISALVQLQQHLLNALWSRLTPGGELLYATCSILPEENDAQIEAFLANHSDASSSTVDCSLGRPTPFGRQLLPQLPSSNATTNGNNSANHDGFYYARLIKAC